MIGSELRGLEILRGPGWTKAGTTDASGYAVWDYPFVAGLAALAGDVRAVFDGAGLARDLAASAVAMDKVLTKQVAAAADLAVMLAISSSLRGKPLPKGFIAFGEVGLAGEVRPAPRGQERLREAAKLGFSVAIVPKAKEGEGTYPTGINLDEGQLEVVDAGISSITVDPKVPTVKLGEKVEDLVTGQKGIATLETVFINGCTYYAVTYVDEKNVTRELFVGAERVKKVSSGVTKSLENNQTPSPTGKKPGGPSTPMRRMC